MHGSRQTISLVVTHPDGIFLGLEPGNRAYRSEDFFLHNLHIFADIGEDGRLDEITLFAVAATSDFDLGAFFLTVLNVSDVT